MVIERETLAGVGAGSRFDRGLIEEICQALKKADMHERAGELYDALERVDEAKEAYARGHAYRRAIELCRSSPNGDAHKASEIRDLEERWGDRLVELKQPESAIGHFAEAGAFMKAAEAAMEARNWKRVLEIVERCAGDERFGVFYRRVARHYERAGDHAQAERCFLRAGEPEQAVEMHCRADRWEAARKVAAGYLSPEAANALYAKRARELEARGDLAQAEKFFLQAKAPDLAIDAYRRARKFDQMIRLVQQHRPERLDETRLLLAKQCEGDGNYREAERRFVEAGDWKSAVKMYRAQSMWEDAVRVAKAGGGGTASKQVAYAWASALGGEAGAALLKKFNLVDGAVDHACEQGAFAHAFDVAKFSGAKHKIPDVEYKYAMFLEDEGKFDDAEEHFVKADKPREAVDMWLHAKEWAKAMRVAETNDPTAVADVLAAQAKAAVEDGEHKDAEASFLKAKRPEAAVDMYRAAGMWDDAVRVCADYLPHRTREIELEAKRAREKGGSGTAGGNPGGEHSVDALLREAESLETAGDYSRARWMRFWKSAPRRRRTKTRWSARGTPPFASPSKTSPGRRARSSRRWRNACVPSGTSAPRTPSWSTTAWTNPSRGTRRASAAARKAAEEGPNPRAGSRRPPPATRWTPSVIRAGPRRMAVGPRRTWRRRLGAGIGRRRTGSRRLSGRRLPRSTASSARTWSSAGATPRRRRRRSTSTAPPRTRGISRCTRRWRARFSLGRRTGTGRRSSSGCCRV